MSKSMEQNPNANHRARLKERCSRNGIEALAEHEVLELLLFYIIKRKDTKPIAKALISEFGSLSNVLDAAPGELIKIDGVGAQSAEFLHLVSEAFKAYRLCKLKGERISASDVEKSVEYARGLFSGAVNEEFYVILVDNRMKIINSVKISQGLVNEVSVYPKKVIEAVIRNNAAAVLLAHNHLAGDCNPSGADIKFTNRVRKLLEDIEIRLLDHLVVSENNFYSFKRNNML